MEKRDKYYNESTENEETKTYLQDVDFLWTWNLLRKILKDYWRKEEGVKMLHRVPPNGSSAFPAFCSSVLFFFFWFFALYRILAGGDDSEVQYV